ncbi:MAG: hypothetical protein JSS01_05120 [Proteobacteria bacterium]|nr:hypothetical protein [Pseudomonadota bacterium]
MPATPPAETPMDTPDAPGTDAQSPEELPEDGTLCPGNALSAPALRQLLRAALPDSSRHKAAGWFDQTDFLFTRSHVDEEQDAFLDGLFITVWKRWDFWLALPYDGPAAAQPSLLRQAWARLRQPAAPQVTDGLVYQYRGYGATGQPGPWRPLQGADTPPEALQACVEAWRGVIAYWRRAEGQRRAGRPLRARLHAALTPERVRALTLLPIFTGRYNDWWDPERNGWWEGDVWIGARQPGQQGGRHWGRALKLSWRNGREAAGDEEDDAHACYQIDLVEDDAPHEGTAHPPGLRLSYAQRQSDARVSLSNDAVDHMARLLRLFTTLEQRLHAEHARQQQALQAAPPEDIPTPPLPHAPPFAPDLPDAEVFGAKIMGLSRDWQCAGRAHAARVRERWALQAEAPGNGDPAALPLVDPRGAQAGAVLLLARAVHDWGDADLSARFHRRFAFAPGALSHRAVQNGRAIGPVLWQADGGLLAYVAPAHGAQAGAWWAVSADGLRIAPAPQAGHDLDMELPADTTTADAHGLTVRGDAEGDLRGLAEDGSTLWRHHIGGAIRSIAIAPDGQALAVGSAGGYLVLLRKGSGMDPYLPSTSRYAEERRFIFWEDAPAPLAW